MSVRISIAVTTFLLVVICAASDDVNGATCSGATYRSPAFDIEISEFSPYDTVYVIVDCSGLTPGEHVMHANWVHRKRGMIRSDSYDFVADGPTKQGIYFWFKLSRKGPIASMLSNEDFYQGNMGDWTVELYLDDVKVSERRFTISEAAQ